MTAPIDYSARATQGLAPATLIDDYTFAHLSHEHAASFAATTGWYFFADIAEYQALIDARYPYQSIGVRLDTGWRLDYHAPANVATWQQMNRAGILLGYVVFIPGQFPAQLVRLRNKFGAQLEGIVPELDVESGSGFAGPGDHSVEANDCMAELAQITGTPARQGGYANGGDWASLWRTHPTSMPRRLADYGPTIVSTGYWAQQFYGGLNYPVPDGFPRACAPFGSWVDLNATRLTPDQQKALFGYDELLEDLMAMYGSRAEYEAVLQKMIAAEVDRGGGNVREALANALRALKTGRPVGWFNKTNVPEVIDGKGV